MDAKRIGKTISVLRKRMGYTQKDLADRIGISDKAVSKWERGVGLPDIGYLNRLSIILDIDLESLLSGNAEHQDISWQGIIYLENNCYGIDVNTIIYDKPLIFYLLSYFLLVGIRDVIIVGKNYDVGYVKKILGDGKTYGVNIRTIIGGLDAVETEKDNIMLLYERCIIYGVDQTRFFRKAMMNRGHLTILALPKKIMHSSSRIIMDKNKRIVNSESDSALRTQYDFSAVPFLFFPSTLLQTISETNDITQFISDYASKNDVYVQKLDRGFVEFDLISWDDVQEATTFLKIVQNKCGMSIYCLEEVAWRRGFIGVDQLRKFGEKYEGTEYGKYILSLYERVSSQ